jgi:hypothetical protein
LLKETTMRETNWQGEMRRLEDAVQKSDGEALRARWASGRYMLDLRKGKQLPRGVLGELAGKLGVHRSELTARMKFASKFPSEAKVAEAISKFRTWYEIKQNALTDKPRKQKRPTASADQRGAHHLRRVLEIFERIDSAELGEAEYALLLEIEEGIKRIKQAVRRPRTDAAQRIKEAA